MALVLSLLQRLDVSILDTGAIRQGNKGIPALPSGKAK